MVKVEESQCGAECKRCGKILRHRTAVRLHNKGCAFKLSWDAIMADNQAAYQSRTPLQCIKQTFKTGETSIYSHFKS